MNRSPMKPSAKPLQRTAMPPRAKAMPSRPLAKLDLAGARAKAPALKARMKSKGPRMTPIRRAAAGQDCTLRIPGVCNFDPTTTVLCHSNYLADGKGMGLKAPDTAAAFGCCACHDVLDGRRPRPAGFSPLDMEGAFYAAVKLTHAFLRREGLMP